MTQSSRRLASIDVMRAITMLLMIFVNDLALVENVPRWLEHAKEGEDRLGLADTVFPAFLFIVGLSIPFAIRRWESKGMSKGALLGHVLSRSFALLVMGIVGGAILPNVFAQLKDQFGFQLVFMALMVPAYIYILLFGLVAGRQGKARIAAAAAATAEI